jgi:hypothetical protein
MHFEITGRGPVDGVIFCRESGDFGKIVRHESIEAAVSGRVLQRGGSVKL